MNSKYALVLAVVLGVVAAFAVHQYIARIQEDFRVKNQPVPVVFAKEDILADTQVREESLEPGSWPFQFLTGQIVPWDQRDKLIGKVASQRIPRGDFVSKQLVDVKREPSPSVGIEMGRRAFTISTDAVRCVAGAVKAGDHVDILGQLKGEAPAGGRKGGSQTSTTVAVLENVLVLGVGSSAGRSWGRSREADLSSVTVSVKPVEAVLLSYAQEQGDLTLVLRRDGDREVSLPPGIDARNVLSLIQQLSRERAGK